MSAADHCAKPGVVAQSSQAVRAAPAAESDRRATELARGVARLTPEDSRLAASLRGLALPVARRLVDDPGCVWERNVDKKPSFSKETFSTKVLLESGETMTFELSSQAWDNGPAERRLTVGVDGSDRTLSIAGTGPMEGVRADPHQRAQVDQLYRDVSQKPGATPAGRSR